MKKLLPILLLAIAPSVALGASYKFKDEVRAGRTLAVAVPAGSPTVLALMPEGFDAFTQPVSSATTHGLKPGKKLRLKVPKAAKPGAYVLVAYDERPGSQVCRKGKCATARANLDDIGEVEVTPARR